MRWIVNASTAACPSRGHLSSSPHGQLRRDLKDVRRLRGVCNSRQRCKELVIPAELVRTSSGAFATGSGPGRVSQPTTFQTFFFHLTSKKLRGEVSTKCVGKPQFGVSLLVLVIYRHESDEVVIRPRTVRGLSIAFPTFVSDDFLLGSTGISWIAE